jgi:hypothetical protein
LFSQGLLGATDKLQFEVTPYLWAPNIEGTLTFDIPPGSNASPNVEVGPVDYLEALDFALMLSGEVHKRQWFVFTDLIYLDFSSEKSTVKSVNFTGTNAVSPSLGLDVNTASSLEGLQWTLAVGDNFVQSKRATLDLFGGFRYFRLEASVDWALAATITSSVGGRTFPRSGTISQSQNLLDAIIGARGRVNLGDSKWYLPYYLDIGGGYSNFTWQGVLGVAYTFKWGDIKLTYRHLDYNTDWWGKLLEDFRFSGPALAATFRF